MDDVALEASRARASGSIWCGPRCRAGTYLLATAHRAGNVDDAARLAALVELSRRRTADGVPLHPRTRARLDGGLLERLRALARCGDTASATWTRRRCCATRVRC